MTTRIRIDITGHQASGKTVTLRAIAKFLETEFACTVKLANQGRMGDIDRAEVTIPDATLGTIAEYSRKG